MLINEFSSGDTVNLIICPILGLSHRGGKLFHGLNFIGINYPRGELSVGDLSKGEISGVETPGVFSY